MRREGAERNGGRLGVNPLRLLERYGCLIALALVIGLGCAIDADFRKPENFVNVLRQSAVVGIIAVGMTLVIIQGGIDLSVGSMLALLGGLSILAMNAAAGAGWGTGWGVVAACAVALGGGLALGSINGVLISVGGIAPFVATLAGMAAFRSLAQLFAGGGAYSADVHGYQVLNDGGLRLGFVEVAPGTPLVIFYPVLAMIVVAAAGEVVLRKTTFGLYVRAIGDNSLAARYAAVRVRVVRASVYGVTGVLCGVAAVFFGARLGAVTSTTDGVFLEVDAIAAVVVGGTSMRGGSGRVWATIVGVLILGFVDNLMSIAVTPWLQRLASSPTNPWLARQGWLASVDANLLTGLIKALIIIAAVLLQRGRRQA